MLAYIALCTLCVGWSLYIYFRWNFGYWRKRGINGPEPTIVFGNYPSEITQKRSLTYEHHDVYKWVPENNFEFESLRRCELSYRQYKGKEEAVGVFSIRKPVLEILTPDLSKQVLVSKFKEFRDNPFADLIDIKSDPLISRNPFFLKGDEWKDKRSQITPAFTEQKVGFFSY